MATTTLVIVSVLSAAEILVILNSLSKQHLQTFLGYKVYVDVLYGLGIMVWMGLSGTISGVIISTFSAFFMTLTLMAAANLVGYRKRKRLSDGTYVWVQYPPIWTIQTITDSALSLKDKAVSKFNDLTTVNKPVLA